MYDIWNKSNFKNNTLFLECINLCVFHEWKTFVEKERNCAVFSMLVFVFMIKHDKNLFLDST